MTTFQQHYDEHRLALVRYAAVLVNHAGEAEDIVQESFLRLNTLLEAGGVFPQVRAWLFRVVRNLAIDTLRRQRRQPAADFDLAWIPAGDDVERTAIHNQRRQRVFAGLRRLTPQERECFALRAEGLPYKAIAETVGTTPAAALDAVRRGVAKLQKAADE